MSQRILLADNSYTIRRIVELSFQDLENVELFSFENGASLKEKLLEIVPQIVLIDIKLPDFSGYDACRFINNEPTLKNTKVLLMKGGFEPIDEELLEGLIYEDIITKPFDSKLLENQVTNLLKDFEGVSTPPISIPDELNAPNIQEDLNVPPIPDEEIKDDISIDSDINIEADTFPDSLPEFGEENSQSGDDGISFSDVNEELVGKVNEDINTKLSVEDNEENIIHDDVPVIEAENDKMNFNDEVDEINNESLLSDESISDSSIENRGPVFDDPEPSEEITQGAFEEQGDNLAVENDEDIINPFKEGEDGGTDELSLKEHIRAHEEELGMDSLTVEEMRIKSDIENRNKGLDSEDEFGTDSFGSLEKEPSFDNISFEEENKESLLDSEQKEKDLSDVEPNLEQKSTEKLDKSIYEAAEGILNDDIDILEENKPEEGDFNISIDDENKTDDSSEGIFSEENHDSLFEKPIEKDEVLEENINEELTEKPEESVSQDEISFGGINIAGEEPNIPEPVVEKPIESNPEPVIEEAEVKNEVPVAELEPDISFPENNFEESIQDHPEPVGSETPTVEQEILSKDEESAESDELSRIEENNLEMNEQKGQTVEKESLNDNIDMNGIMNRVEEKLTVAVKEILWEIIPPLAEKIIKKEVEDLEKEIEEK